MSTEIKSAAVEAVAEALFRWNTPTDPYFVIHGRFGEYADEDCYLPIARAALAAVETARGVRIVDADALVIDRADMPEVSLTSDGAPWCYGQTTQDAGKARAVAIAYLALAEYLDAHPPVPPVSDEDVETLAGLLESAELTNPAEGTYRPAARRLLATGRVTVTNE